MSPIKSKNDRLTSYLFTASCTLISILFAGISYFVRTDFIEKLEKTENMVFRIREQLAVLEAIVQSLKEECRTQNREAANDQRIQEGRIGKGF